MTAWPKVPIFVEHWGYNLQFYPNFALFSTLGWINLDHDFFQLSKLSEDQKKVFAKNETLFSPSSCEYQKKSLHQNWSTFFPEFKWRPALKCTPRRAAKNAHWGGLSWGFGGGAPSRQRPTGVWRRSPQMPEAGGLGAEPPAAGDTGVWRRSPQRLKNLHFFAKIT